MQKFFCIKIFIIHEDFFLLFMLHIEIIIHYNDTFKIESFDNRLQKFNQYSLYHIKISNWKQLSKKSFRSRSYKHEKNNKITTYSFHAHEHFWKMRYNQHRFIFVRLQNRQYKIKLRTISTKLQSNFIQKTIFSHHIINRTTNLSIFMLII